MKRRTFLRAAAAGAAGIATTAWPHWLRADTEPWGAYPDFALGSALPAERRAKNVLEVFLRGGIAPWETFYAVPREDYGHATRDMWWTFQDGPNSVPEWHDTCGGTGPLTIPHGVDALGTEVSLGPFVAPLRDRSDIVDRLRLHVVSHALFPHEGARAIAATGIRIGSPRVAGVGAPVQRALQPNSTSGLPTSYVIGDSDTGFWSASGTHPASSKPLALEIAYITSQAASWRDRIAEAPDADVVADLLRHQANTYQRRFVPHGATERVRAPAVANLMFALDMRDRAPELGDIITDPRFAITEVDHCRLFGVRDISAAQFRLAATLLRSPDVEARHVTVIDEGYGQYDNRYDTHDDHVQLSAQTLSYMWTRLVDIINLPGEDDPTKIDLDDTLVIINTEFGRSPGVQGTTGRNHYPTAYTTAMFGGPVGTAQRGIVGAISASASPIDALTPAATRAATLVALGIWPFAQDAYSSSDLGMGDELEASLMLRDRVLGFVP